MNFYTPPPRDAFAGMLPPIPLPPFRHALETHIERMIDMLDALDGDADLEPSLAGISGLGDDLEGDDSDLEDSGDEHEPLLGSLGGTAPYIDWHPSSEGRQTNWAGGRDGDRELDDCDDEDGHDQEASDLAGFGSVALEGDDHEDLEPDEDREPALGWPESGEGEQHLTTSHPLGLDVELCAPAGFCRLRLDRHEAQRSADAEYRRVGAFIRRASGWPDPQAGNLREARP